MTEHVSVRQVMLWLVMYQIGSAFLLLPSALAGIAGRDAWLSVAISVAAHLLLIPLYAAIARQMRGRSFSEYLCGILGKWGGTALSVSFMAVVPFLIFIMTLRNLADYVLTSIAPDMSEDVIYAVMLVAVFIAVRAGAQVVGRSAEILFFILPVLYLIVTVTLLPTTRPDLLLPVAEYGWKPILRASFPLLAFPYLETVLFLAFVPYMKDSRAWSKAVLRSGLISGAMYLIMMIHVIAVVGGKVAANMTFASYLVVRTISIGDFIERFEIVVAIIWYISIFFRLTLLLLIAVRETAIALRLKEESALLIPAMLIAFVMAPSIWPNLAYLYDMFRTWPSYAMTFGIVLPAVLWLVGRARGGQHA